MLASWKAFYVAISLSLLTIMKINGEQYIQPCNPCCDSPCGRWWFDSDTIYWTACQEGLTYGSETRAQTIGDTGSLTEFHTKKKHLHQRWDFGWRFGLGYQSPCCWDVGLTWTNFDTDMHAKHEEAVNQNQWFTPAWGGIAALGLLDDQLLGGNIEPPFGFPVDEAWAHWKLRLNLIDLEIARDYCVNSCLTLRPHIGVRGASINERYEIEYEVFGSTFVPPFSIIPSTPPPLRQQAGPALVIDKLHLSNDFEGAGIRGGLETTYDLGCGLSLYGGVAASLLYGETEIKTKERLLNGPDLSSDVFEMIQKDRECGCRAITDAELGIKWTFCCYNRIIVSKLGWEHHFYFNENQFEKFTNYNGTDNAATDRFPNVLHGNLSIQGIVWTARIYF